MSTENRLILSGKVYKVPIRKVSPSGIPHCFFLLEHRSIQQEVCFSRQAWCRLSVVISGAHNLSISSSIIIGAQITVKGFISCEKGRNGLSKIVLHAEKIDFIDSGD
ncbi:primosomal replication protein N [secondary endosymbiont of Ctenarytaina eucalypti]|uniref:Replication restart protein PriB n=1 Tax=secondary endosymbiont of Ctenarytaina eucalypti TaxID=1199245 RepID=J3TWV5_9ENTR|nr:primosomal replication protein N [secondary endosymbiont of Ctenarytaina eucalypti]AFP84505.1 primosomal replication protein N [secondary endosymbiont of Ctenarytaina eucalypti]